MTDHHDVTSFDPIALNVAIIRAFGLDPQHVRSCHIELDRDLGPVVTAVMYKQDDAGKYFVEDGEVATVLKEYKLVEHDPMEA